jgi:hypothetical protein
MTPYLLMVLAGFAAFVAALGFVSTANMIQDARAQRDRTATSARRTESS